MVTGTLTPRILQNDSKLCTKMWERPPWCGAPGISSGDSAASPSPRSLPGRQSPHHTNSLASRAGGPAPRRKQLLQRCLSSRRVQTDRYFSRSDGECIILDQNNSPSQKPGGTRGVKELQATYPLARCFLPFAERRMLSALWTRQQPFTRNLVQCWTSS